MAKVNSKSLLAIVLLNVTQALQDQSAIGLVNRINEIFAVKTNIFIFNVMENRDSEILADKNYTTPRILVTEETNFELIYSLHKNLLVFVFINQASIDESFTFNLLNRVLHRMHESKVLLLYKEDLIDVEDLLSLFKLCWRFGYTRVMAAYGLAKTSVQIQLATFCSFPNLHIKLITEEVDYFQLVIPNDFQGHAIRTPVANDAPSVFVYFNRQGKRVYSGMYFKIFYYFIEHFNATIKEIHLPPPYPQRNFMDITKALYAEDLDISPHCYFTNYEKWLTVYPIFLATQYLQVPYASPRERRNYILAPFEAETWLVIAAYVVLVTIISQCGKIIARKMQMHSQNKDYIVSSSNCVETFSQVIVLTFFSPNASKPQPHQKHILLMYLLQAFLGFVLANLYNTLLASFLTTTIYETQLNTIQDVIASKYKIEILKYELPFFPDDRELRAKLTFVNDEELATHTNQLNNTVMRVISPWKHNFLAHQQMFLRTPLVKLIDNEVLWNIAGGFIMPFNSPYLELITQTTKRAFESGLVLKAFDDTTYDGIEAKLLTFFKDEEQHMQSLGVAYFEYAWYLLAVGCALSVGTFLIEVLAK